MKRFGSAVSQVASYGLALVAAAFAFSASAAQQGFATVQAIKFGTAQYSDDGSTWKSLALGQRLKAGNTIKTDANAVVDLFLKDNGPVLRVTRATTLALTTLTFEKVDGEHIMNTELGLSNGRILGNVRKLAAASKYDVKTPVGTCGIRGTKFDISSGGRISVVSGIVQIMYTKPGDATATTFTVTEGNTFEPTANNGAGGIIPTPSDANRQLNVQIETITTPGSLAVVILPPPPRRPDEPDFGNTNVIPGQTDPHEPVNLTPGVPQTNYAIIVVPGTTNIIFVPITPLPVTSPTGDNP
jgi:hypothetical protein